MPRVEDIKRRLWLDFEKNKQTAPGRGVETSEDQRFADVIEKLQHLAASVNEIPDDVAIKYDKLREGDDLCMEETGQIRQRIGFSDNYASALDFVNALIRKQTRG